MASAPVSGNALEDFVAAGIRNMAVFWIGYALLAFSGISISLSAMARYFVLVKRSEEAER